MEELIEGTDSSPEKDDIQETEDAGEIEVNNESELDLE